MMPIVRMLAPLALVVSSAACTGPATERPAPTAPPTAPPTASPAAPPTAPPTAAADRLVVFKSLGRRQCEAGGETPATLAAQLKSSGVDAMPAGCANDGMMYAAVCGGGDGVLGLLDIAAADAAAAAKAGFRPFSDLPDASRQPCPGTAEAPQKK
jgi:hypothetical protein